MRADWLRQPPGSHSQAGRRGVVALALDVVSLALLLSIPWAYEALRPLRDAADPNEAVWASASIACAAAALLLSLRRRDPLQRWAFWIAVALMVVWAVLVTLLLVFVVFADPGA